MHLHEVQHRLHRRCNIIDVKHHIICAAAQLHFVSAKRNDVDRKWSNDVLTAFVMMLCPYGHKYKKASLLTCFFGGGERGIRTLGTVSGSHTFQACALDQLSHLSILIIKLLIFNRMVIYSMVRRGSVRNINSNYAP